ncbi:MAG: hypothetical protein J1F11_03890 [Oscillospiraceae bacterium]|nr:hypothetical protein [Oscillospiraceae bacterium]
MFELRFKRISIAFDFSFFATVALLTLLNETNAVLGLAACLWHELGHLIVMEIKGVPLKKVLFYGAGIKIVPDRSFELADFGTELAVLLAGSSANFIVSAGLWFCGDIRLKLFSVINAVIGAFNLLPVLSLDGGGLIVAVIRRYCDYERACQLESWLGRINGILIVAVLAAFALFGKGNLTLYITLCYLLVVSFSKGS